MMTDLDVVKVRDELQAAIRKARAAASHSENETLSSAEHPAVGADQSFNESVGADLASLHTGYDIIRAPFYSHRRRFGRAIIGVKNLAKELLMQILVRQVKYNGANTRVVTHLRHEIETLRLRIEEIRTQAEMDKASLRADLQVALAATVAKSVEDQKRERDLKKLAAGYFRFEDKHRGSEAVVAERQHDYLNWYAGQSDVIDIGCGRGEFLGLLREAHITQKGVDNNPEMVAYCRRKGLEVVNQDAIEYLERLPRDSVGGIFCAQMIEHLEPARLPGFIDLCHSKMRPGGVLVVETPNPGCLMVFATSFYKDLTHTRPYHPASVMFLFESAGFADVQLEFSSPVDPSLALPKLTSSLSPDVENFNEGIERLNHLIFGYQDYVVIGKKAGPPDHSRQFAS